MQWKKRGLIFKPSQEHSFCHSRVICPTPFLLNNDIIRIYCGFCDNDKISRVGFIDVSIKNPSQIINISNEPLINIGEDGMFDDNGLVPTTVFKLNNIVYMYYFGFQIGIKIPFYMFSGLAISEDNGKTFQRLKKTPILDRTDSEPIMRSGPFVIYDEEHKIFKMWYPSGDKFININEKKIHTYVLKYLESANGVEWESKGQVVMNHASADEYGFGRPYVVKTNDMYELYYSIRTFSKGYRIGYATSINGKDWQRRDEKIGIDVSSNDWDSEMICYSAVISAKNKTYLFYNGNNLGDTGFGYAELLNK
jgi:predicted GH43/DUF377 family glycosyl hydrolase